MTTALLKQALDALLCCSPDHKAGAALQIRTVKDLRAHLAEPAVAHPDPWREAIDAELVCLHLGTVDSFPDAGAALNALIDWHVAVALDPEVSSAAQALIDRGAAVAVPVYQFRRVGCADWYDGHPDCEDGRGPYQTRKLYADHGINGSKT